MAHQNELKETELQVPDAFKACEALSKQIDAFSEKHLNGKLTTEKLPSVCLHSTKLLEVMKAALNEARTKVPVENKHKWVEHWTWMQWYEEAVATMEQIDNTLQTHDRLSKQSILMLESAYRTLDYLEPHEAAEVLQEVEIMKASFRRDGD
ncbi:hypothetical protein J4E93_005337 [Alternaria ventricosa]|uniref:uncharacterized protein n=1 Tax=Alternaria ventricosa TaxID=1187951 RepID=UPI0020C47B17|nr:uncharacterized protein J4E93_005337 [Alternaria ventricosa]KAI4645759.1 hypothetical protein J4E93_005337 [Alternaria ventricosa]